ncbi:hypothetical protein Barb6_03938 [Bacteroidales bacterium Barb6]|nr:hypothetical protein Barb6_03938 [Bacteroidales bacterium Barb6]
MSQPNADFTLSTGLPLQPPSAYILFILSNRCFNEPVTSNPALPSCPPAALTFTDSNNPFVSVLTIRPTLGELFLPFPLRKPSRNISLIPSKVRCFFIWKSNSKQVSMMEIHEEASATDNLFSTDKKEHQKSP